MNQDSRKKLKEIVGKLEELKDDQEDVFQNMGPGLQVSPSGMAVEEAIDSMDAALSALEEIN